eukprot:TRINITY_DN9375_c0_g1_i1.p1 TRINITY_DN9375_c0_g1~~TRINITY_DN9375_c0_g1_i1.p1  ORF type:complete len:376 (-),score=56.51 TRINITY_DN9375_c0_g1_i1:99-1226(-)
MILKNFDELPVNIRSIVLESRIEEDAATQYFSELLNVVRFKLNQDFYTKKSFRMSLRHKKLRKKNVATSLVSPDLISIDDLSQESHNLCDNDFKRKWYKNCKLIGSGGFGSVYLCKSKRDKRICKRLAIKVMNHDTERRQRKNFQEVRFLKFLSGHPNMLLYVRSSIYKKEMVIATEYISGSTLSKIISYCAPLSEDVIVYILNGLLQGLNYIHSNFIAHRDIKPSNIMITKGGVIKIIDYGLCADTSNGPLISAAGSSYWMAPELINREPHGTLVDIWSIGIIIMQMITGHLPARNSFQALFKNATVGYINEIKKLNTSGLLMDFTSKCLTIDQEDRKNTDQLLHHEYMLTESCTLKVICLINQRTIFMDKVGV